VIDLKWIPISWLNVLKNCAAANNSEIDSASIETFDFKRKKLGTNVGGFLAPVFLLV
jgi:hypothetical protein